MYDDIFMKWFSKKYPELYEKWNDPLYFDTEWRNIYIKYIIDISFSAFNAGIESERKRRVICETYTPNLEKLRELEDFLL